MKPLVRSSVRSLAWKWLVALALVALGCRAGTDAGTSIADGEEVHVMPFDVLPFVDGELGGGGGSDDVGSILAMTNEPSGVVELDAAGWQRTSGFAISNARLVDLDIETKSGLVCALVFDGEQQSAQLVAQLSRDAPVRTLAVVEGAVATFASRGGCVVVEESLGERWRWQAIKGGFAPSANCGRPNSIRRLGDEGPAFEALTVSLDGVASSLVIDPTAEGGLACASRELETMRPISIDARMVELASPTRRALVDLAEGELSIATLDGVRVGPAATLSIVAESLDAASTAMLDDGHTLLVAMTARPRLRVAIELSPGPAGSVQVVDFHIDPIEGRASRAFRRPSRDLVILGPHVVVPGVVGLSVAEIDDERPALLRPMGATWAEDLRSPLAISRSR